MTGLPINWYRFKNYLVYDAGRDPKREAQDQRFYNILANAFADRDFTRDGINDLLTELYQSGRKPSTINQYIKFLRHVAKCANLDWVDKIKYRPREDYVRDVLTTKEIVALITCPPIHPEGEGTVHYRFSVAIETLFSTGMRISELRGIRWDDVSDDRIIVRISKNKSGRLVKITQELSTRIRSLPHYPHEYVFGTKFGPLFPQHLRDELKQRCKRVGITKQVSCHTARRTVATQAADNGANLVHIARFLGHKNVQSTMGYIQTSEKSLTEVSSRIGINAKNLTYDEIKLRTRDFIESLELGSSRIRYSEDEQGIIMKILR